jgi:hypothetical protein
MVKSRIRWILGIYGREEKSIQTCGRKNHEGNALLGCPRCGWKDNIKLDLKVV